MPALILPSKFFLAPINTGFSKDNHLEESLYRFHEQRSGNGIGISYVGNVAVSDYAKTNSNTLTINQTNKSEWSLLAEIISTNGSIPGIQLGCRLSSIPAQKDWINPDADRYIEKVKKEILQYSTDIFDDVVNSYVESAKLAWSCGYKVIQIHAAHGYFLSLMISDSFNSRRDAYGAQGLKLITDIVKNIHSAVPGAALDIRLSVFEGVKPMLQELHEKKRIIDKITKLPLAIISLSNGIYNVNKYYIYIRRPM